jgi:hypothetical protein
MKYTIHPASAFDLRYLNNVEPFQEILNLLLRFEERMNPADLDALHFMRRAVSAADPDDLTVLLGRLEDNLYYVCVRLETEGGQLRTSWLHEDEIYREREIYSDDSSHPVHQILCLTDLYARASVISEEDFLRLESGE